MIPLEPGWVIPLQPIRALALALAHFVCCSRQVIVGSTNPESRCTFILTLFLHSGSGSGPFLLLCLCLALAHFFGLLSPLQDDTPLFLRSGSGSGSDSFLLPCLLQTGRTTTLVDPLGRHDPLRGHGFPTAAAAGRVMCCR